MCTVDGCDRPGRTTSGAGICNTHYFRVWRGSKKTGPIGPYGQMCVVEDCGLPNTARGYCSKHYARFMRNGDPLVTREKDRARPQLRGADNPCWADRPAYTTMHQRLTRLRGPASRYRCVDCSRTAQEWSYDWSCPDEMEDRFGVYSADPNRYEPRCRSCHQKFDREHAALVPKKRRSGQGLLW